MNKDSALSIASLLIYIVLLYTLVTGASYGVLNILVIAAMLLFAALGIFFGRRAPVGFARWTLLILNIIAIVVPIRRVAFGFGISES